MRLVFITNAFPSPIDPTKGVFNRSMIRALAVEHIVHVISPIPWIDEIRARRDNLSVGTRRRIVDNASVFYPRYFYTPGVLRTWYGAFLWQSVRNTMQTILREGRPDAVLAYWAHPDGAAAVHAARDAGIPSAIIVGGSDVLLMTRNLSRRRSIANALSSTDRVITVSANLKSKIVELGVEPDRVHLWERGVGDQFRKGNMVEAREKLKVAPDAQVLLWVGRMVPVKGLDVLLAACARLKSERVPFQLYLVGDGPLRKQFEARVAGGDLRGSVHFVGIQSPEQLPDWYRAADLTVLPSHSEGLPNVLRESLACGTPFVASRVGGIPEVAGASDECLVKPGDSDDLARAIANALAQPDFLQSLKFHSPTWSQSAQALIDILQPLLSRNARSVEGNDPGAGPPLRS